MKEVVVVSGLPRSGTSMMMRMLEAGGLPILTDAERAADEDNPRGYFELEAVKRTDKSEAWLDGAGGKAVKVISELLKDLPPGPRYKVIFMRRNLDEVLASQQKMLARRGQESGLEDEKMKSLFAAHVEEVETYLRGRADMEVLFVSYSRMVSESDAQVKRVHQFLGGELDAAKMKTAVEPDLYRNRS